MMIIGKCNAKLTMRSACIVLFHESLERKKTSQLPHMSDQSVHRHLIKIPIPKTVDLFSVRYQSMARILSKYFNVKPKLQVKELVGVSYQTADCKAE